MRAINYACILTVIYHLYHPSSVVVFLSKSLAPSPKPNSGGMSWVEYFFVR